MPVRHSSHVRHLAAFALLILANEVHAGELKYDPDSCTTDAQGMVYIALGRVVLRLPADELTGISGTSPERKAEFPSPPNPSEPEGCPLHPIQDGGFYFAYRYEAMLRNKVDPRLPAGSPDLLQLIAVSPDYWGLQPAAEKAFRRMCERYNDREEMPSGLTVCRGGTKDRAREFWAAYYQADPDVYSAPFDRPFIVDCRPGNSLSGSQRCDVRYKLSETLNVVYRLDIRKVPMSEVIAFDRGLRAKIEAARVKDFIWPDEAALE